MEKYEKYGYPPVQRPVPEQRRAMATLRPRKCINLLWPCLFSACFVLFIWHMNDIRTRPVQVFDANDWGRPHKSAFLEETLVPLEVHIMSKCPDALDCLEKLVVPTMAQTSSKVNFTLSYIGQADPSHEDEVTCKHGPSECLGNILELCAAHVYPDPKIHLGFTLCLSRKYQEIPGKNLIHDCALEHGMDFDKLNDCASKEDGAFGMKLLRRSVEWSESVNATVSCTVRLAGEKRCVRDDGTWKECDQGSSVESLVGDIEKIWKEQND